jgi:hypothetical protein
MADLRTYAVDHQTVALRSIHVLSPRLVPYMSGQTYKVAA